MSTVEELSTSLLVKKLDQADSIIIDVRPIAAYNGWALQGEQRGGHIARAKSIPLMWTQYMDWVEVLEEKANVQID
ncbi:MAG: rhodanese-like domain-containing protein [Balneolaceae bacterium]|nr:rhodanese-like domain-containing protein [Balneolaceae bacterium]